MDIDIIRPSKLNNLAQDTSPSLENIDQVNMDLIRPSELSNLAQDTSPS